MTAFAKDRDAEWEAALGELSSSLACGSPENKTPDQWSKIISDGIDMLTQPLVEQLAAERAAKEDAEQENDALKSCNNEICAQRAEAIHERDKARAEVEKLRTYNRTFETLIERLNERGDIRERAELAEHREAELDKELGRLRAIHSRDEAQIVRLSHRLDATEPEIIRLRERLAQVEADAARLRKLLGKCLDEMRPVDEITDRHNQECCCSFCDYRRLFEEVERAALADGG